MQVREMENYIQQLLEPWKFRDYAPNGVQVEGRSSIGHIVSGVTANIDLIEAAIERNADAVLVHHGWFWKNEDVRVVGIKRRRLGLLLQHDISLFAYHLPLDAHPELGNNAQLARLCGFQADGVFGDQDLGLVGSAPAVRNLEQLNALVGERLGQSPLLIGDPRRSIQRIAWCTGAAQSYFQAAIDAGADVFITGEISEPMVHLARESGVAYLAAGHHATERYGVQALGEHLAQRFGLRHSFVNIPSPV